LALPARHEFPEAYYFQETHAFITFTTSIPMDMDRLARNKEVYDQKWLSLSVHVYASHKSNTVNNTSELHYQTQYTQ